MATTIVTVPVFTAAAPGRVVHRLVVPAPVPSPVPAAPSVGPARSPFWQNRLDTLETERSQLAELQALKGGVNAIDSAISGISLPASFNVITQMSAADAALIQRGVEAAEQLADNTKPQPDTCAARDDLSDLAYTVIARLTTLAGALMDRQSVTLDSVLAKLADRNNVLLANEVGTLLAGTAATEALALLTRALDPVPFSLWVQQGVPQDDPRVYDELNRRAAFLLAAKCVVATTVTGPALDWPPPPPTPTPTPATGVPGAASTAQPARARRARP